MVLERSNIETGISNLPRGMIFCLDVSVLCREGLRWAEPPPILTRCLKVIRVSKINFEPEGVTGSKPG